MICAFNRDLLFNLCTSNIGFCGFYLSRRVFCVYALHKLKKRFQREKKMESDTEKSSFKELFDVRVDFNVERICVA